MSVTGICRKHLISDTIFYKWKSKYSGLEVSEARRLKQLEGPDRDEDLRKRLWDLAEEGGALAVPGCAFCFGGTRCR